ncbi:MAG: GatB/YqeY domain-containing protein [Proteobacteria bacterium]|nr:GatB/YqeY domain-containing protein [Pseudomonadota bacterium]MCH8220002.1 GatB/YqeY domain-containing protein [Pseudomonadota bacterium]
MPSRSDIENDMKTALKGGEKERLVTIRMLLAAIQQKEVDERIELDEVQIIGVAEKLIKQRRESADLYRKAEREELAAKEESEILILKAYLPEPLGEAELAALIDEVIRETGASNIKDMGQVMGQIKARAHGRADMAKVSPQVRALLAG